MAMPDPKLFIVWSSKYKYIAEQIHSKLQEKRKTGFPVCPVMFNINDKLHVNSSLHASLVEMMDSSDYALILLTPDEEVLRREHGSQVEGASSTRKRYIFFDHEQREYAIKYRGYTEVAREDCRTPD